MEFHILNIVNTGLLLGVTFYDNPEEGYSYEVNIFLFIITLHFRWYEKNI